VTPKNERLLKLSLEVYVRMSIDEPWEQRAVLTMENLDSLARWRLIPDGENPIVPE